jgi:hypothetical protein
MLRQRSKSWCWGLVLLAVLGPAVALACKPERPHTWKQKSPDGRFEVTLKHKDERRTPMQLSLREVRTGKVRWNRPLDTYYTSRQVLIAPSGRYVALTDEYSPTVVLLGPDGRESGRWSLDKHFTEAELRGLSDDSCGVMWLGDRRFEKDVLVLEVLIGSARRPNQPRFQDTLVRIDARTGQLTREPPRAEEAPPATPSGQEATPKKDAPAGPAH